MSSVPAIRRAPAMDALFDALPDAAMFTDQERRILRVNRAFLEVFGRDERDVVGQLTRVLYASDEEFRAAAVHWRALSAELPATRFEVTLVRKGGESFAAMVTGGIIVDDGGATLGYVGILRDVEDERRAQATLAETSAKLAAEGRRKDEFLAMLSHELRNPLAPIIPALEILRGDKNRLESERKCLDIIHRQTRKLRRLVDDLLDLSRIKQGKTKVERTRLDLAAVIEQAIETAAPLIEQRRHHLEVDVADRLWTEGDAMRLEQVIGNLLNNAAKYTDPGGSIRLDGRREGDELVISVADSGVGIPRESLAHLFEPFAQLDHPVDRSQGGLGIGLALVQSLVELHGGTVRVDSAGVGRGSRFEVRLPAREPPAPSAARSPSMNDPALSGLTVLVVDDNADAAEMLCEILTMWGCRTRVAHDGPTALAIADELRPALAILDISLPGMDGYQIASEIRRRQWSAHTHIVALSGYGREADQARSRDAGFVAHLVKPVDLASLRRMVESLAEQADERS